jgi:hypothetical protein
LPPDTDLQISPARTSPKAVDSDFLVCASR